MVAIFDMNRIEKIEKHLKVELLVSNDNYKACYPLASIASFFDV